MVAPALRLARPTSRVGVVLGDADSGVIRVGNTDWVNVTLWTEDGPGGLVLAGDQIIPGISSNIGVYPSEPEADPLAEWLESCARLRRVAYP